jgi:hypothetical protein
VDIYEIAVLRILVKKHNPIKVSNLINGFPDNSEGYVLQAVSNLHFLGYIAMYDSLPQHISLTKDMRKEVLKIVNPNLNNDSQTKQYLSNRKIVNPNGATKADEIKNNRTINSRPVVVTRTIALAVIVISSVIVGGASMLRYIPMANNQESVNSLVYHPITFSPTISKFQPSSTSIHAHEAGLNSFTVTTTYDPGGGSFIDNVFVVEDTNNTDQIIIVDAGTSTTIYLKNPLVVLNI